jgi:hypothetical protein
MIESRMEKPDDALEIELTNSSIQQLIDGEDPAWVKARLETRLDPELANPIFQSAYSRYAAAKQSGTLTDLQYELAF